MRIILNYVVCLYLGGMALWYADRIVNTGIPAPHGWFMWLHEAILTWMVIHLWADRIKE
jgi:hypothetical protein